MSNKHKRGGLHPRVMANDDHIDPQHWTHLVGECSACPSGYLIAVPEEDMPATPIPMYEAVCNHCGHAYVCPGGRVLRSSSRHSEMPPQFWAKRDKRLKGEGH